MSEFTLSLQEVLGNPETIAQACETPELVGLDQYPIFSENHRFVLNEKIITHFWTREIGWETAELFRLGMHRKLLEIMPYYNQLYESEQMRIDPFLTMEIWNENESSSESENQNSGTTKSEGKSNSKSKGRNLNSEFPQTRLEDDGDYATNAQDSVADADTTNTGKDESSNRSDDKMRGRGTSKTRGFQGSQSELLTAFRSTILNLDMEIIAQLESQFMLIWSTNDSYTGGSFGYGRYTF